MRWEESGRRGWIKIKIKIMIKIKIKIKIMIKTSWEGGRRG